MSARIFRTLVIVGLLCGLAWAAQGQNKSLVSVPAGTTVMPPKYAEDQPALDLKPEEQVAFLYVYGLWFLEQQCLDKDMGVGRLCALGELITGVKTPAGGVLGLSLTPVKDTNYRYEILIIGEDCVIQAVPRVKGLGGFATLGSPRRSSGDFWFSATGDMTRAVKLVDDVPLGHKVAMRAIASGKDVIEYGRVIGIAVQDAPEGSHVHTHCIKTKRWAS